MITSKEAREIFEKSTEALDRELVVIENKIKDAAERGGTSIDHDVCSGIMHSRLIEVLHGKFGFGAGPIHSQGLRINW